jgi:drug/metabolite transporter (DMT)-like permease
MGKVQKPICIIHDLPKVRNRAIISFMIKLTNNKKLPMHLCALSSSFLWALGYVLTRYATRHFSTEAISFLRYAIAAITLLSFASYRKMSLPKLKDIPLFLLGGAMGFAIYVYFINEGSRTLTASSVSFIISGTPIVTAFLAQILLREKIGLLGWLAIVCAFTGVGIITYFSGGFTFTSGAVWICFAMVLISLYNIYQRKLLLRYTPLEITTYCIVAGAFLLSIFAPQSLPQLANASALQVIAMIILGVFSAAVSYLCWAFALSKADRTSEVTNYMFITPLLTILMGFVLLGETPHISAYIGGALILGGVLLVKKGKHI